MPLQLRRGTTAERLSIVPLPGEPILDTDLNTIFIGNGIAAGGISAITGITSEDAMDIVGQMFTNGQHDNIIFTYGSTQDAANRIDVRLDLSGYDGEISASGFRGSLFADDSTLLVNADTGVINASAISGTFGGPVAASQMTTAILNADNIFGILTGDVLGSVFSDSSTLLVNGVDGSINLDGTVKGDIIPDTNEAYDLGSNANRFKDLYLSGTSLFLGAAQITAAGSAVNLPAGSTVDGVSIGTGDGVVQGSDYNINIVADDSTMLIDSTNVKINLDGTVKGDIIPDQDIAYDIGSLTYKFRDIYLSGSTINLGAAQITAAGSAVNLPAGSTIDGVSIGTGTGTGDGVVQGSDYNINIVGDDSSIIVNSSTRTINAFDVVATSITTPLIRTNDSSDIILESPVRIASRIQFDSESVFEDEAVFLSDNSLSRVATMSQHHDDVFAAGLAFRRSRGTFTSPSVLQPEDVMGQCDFIGYDANGNYTRCASVKGVVDSTIFGGIIPGRLEFITNNTLGNSVRRLYIDGNGFIYLESILRQTFTEFAGGFQATGYYQSYSTTGQVRPHAYFKSRGTFIAPTAIDSGDEIAKITFNSYNGTGYVEGASILVANVGGVIGSSAPSRIIFRTDDGTGLSGKVFIRHTGILAANFGIAVRGPITPVDVDADLDLDPSALGTGTIDLGVPEQATVGAAGIAAALPATPSTYFKIKVNGVAYVVPAYAVS